MPYDPAYDIIKPGMASGNGAGMDYPWQLSGGLSRELVYPGPIRKKLTE